MLPPLVPGDPTKSNAVVQSNVIADFGSLAYHDAHTVINKKMFANLCAGMNFNTS